MIKDYFILAFKNLKKRGIRSWLTLLGILIGVAAVISLISLGNGLKAAVNGQFNVGSTSVLTVQAGGVNNYGPPGSGAVKPLTTDDTDAIGKLGNVEVAISRNVRTSKAEFNNKVSFGYSVSIPDNQKNANYVYQFAGISIEQGKLLAAGDRGVIVLGSTIADSATFGKAVKIGDKITVNGKDFKVQGILKKSGSFIYNSIIFMNEVDMKNLLGYGNNVDEIGVKVIDKNLINQTADEITRLMRQRRNVKVGQEDFDVSTPTAALATVNQILSGIQIFIIIIASISIAVGAIGITNTMTTAVLERKKEIGIMKAIGARNEHIFYQFFIEAGLLGLIGGIIGALLGVAIGEVGVAALNSFLGSQTGLIINFWLLFFTMLGSFLIGAISGFVPALKAARENPVEDIRA
jgi:putative ABC transport system permease protein